MSKRITAGQLSAAHLGKSIIHRDLNGSRWILTSISSSTGRPGIQITCESTHDTGNKIWWDKHWCHVSEKRTRTLYLAVTDGVTVTP